MQTPGSVAAGAALLDDDTALLVDFDRIVGHEMGIVVQDEQAGVNHGRAEQRDVVEHVLRLLDAGGGVDIAAEGGADALKPVQDALLREVLRAVEAHVLEEVSQTVLVRGLLDRAHVGRQVEFGPSFGSFIVQDIISQAIVQLSLADGRVVGKLRHFLGKQRGGAQENGSHRKKEFLHSRLNF